MNQKDPKVIKKSKSFMFLSILRKFLYTTSERLHGLEILKRSKLKNNKLCGTLFDENVAVFCFKSTSVGLQMSGKNVKIFMFLCNSCVRFEGFWSQICKTTFNKIRTQNPVSCVRTFLQPSVRKWPKLTVKKQKYQSLC